MAKSGTVVFPPVDEKEGCPACGPGRCPVFVRCALTRATQERPANGGTDDTDI